ncbi:hypothetical protein [Arthrobacter zhaoguopingii]|nr:hypothetical protein [Arthrobacter zhaoguopingii]
MRNSSKLREDRHPAMRLGRTSFYGLLTADYSVVSLGSRRRALVVE